MIMGRAAVPPQMGRGPADNPDKPGRAALPPG
jgi:hypothetical protein